MIGFECQSCREKIDVPDSLGGLTETCPTCGATMRVPLQFDCNRCGQQLQIGGMRRGQIVTCIKCGKRCKSPSPAAEHPTAPTPVIRPAPQVSDEGGVNFDAPICHFFTEIVGVTYENDDGASREEIVRMCGRMEPLSLAREPDNPHDPNAVSVERLDTGEQLGHVGRFMAKHICEDWDAGCGFTAFFVGFTGKGADLCTVKMVVFKAQPHVSDAEAQAYADSVNAAILDRARHYSTGFD